MDSVDQMESSSQSDMGGMVLVMGVTGAGKSTFINALKPESVTVGHTLESSKRITFLHQPWMSNTGHQRLTSARVKSPGATTSHTNIPG